MPSECQINKQMMINPERNISEQMFFFLNIRMIKTMDSIRKEFVWWFQSIFFYHICLFVVCILNVSAVEFYGTRLCSFQRKCLYTAD